MKVDVEVVRVEQIWDVATLEQQNFLVFKFAGVEVKVPCSEQKVVEVIKEIAVAKAKKGVAPAPNLPVRVAPPQPEAIPEREFQYTEEEPLEQSVEFFEEKPASAPVMFQVAQPAPKAQPQEAPAPQRRALAPVSRPRVGVSTDDARFSQG